MIEFKTEILKRLCEEDSQNLSSIGKRVIEEFDEMHAPTNANEIKVIGQIAVMARWIKELTNSGNDWYVAVDEGLPFIIPLFDEK